MTDAITWTNDTRLMSDLVPWEHNPKRMTKKHGEGLRVSLDKFGLAIPLCISPENDLYDGHQRKPLLEAMKNYGPSATVDVRVSSRVFTEDERREFVIRLRQNQAGWDFDMLPNLYEKEELLEWGFLPFELGITEGDNPEEEWGGMPEFEQQDAFGAFLTIKVHFANQEAADTFAALVGQPVNGTMKYIWFPKLQRENLKAYQVVDDVP